MSKSTTIIKTSDDQTARKLRSLLASGVENVVINTILPNWRDTKLIVHLDDVKLKTIITRISGDDIFQGSSPGSGEYAYNYVKNILERSIKPYYTRIHPGDIVHTPPTYEQCVQKVAYELKNDQEFYRRQGGYLEIIDKWAFDQEKHKCSTAVESQDEPRFIGKPMTENEFLRKQASQCEGILSEGFVVSYLNQNVACPECGVTGKVGWCKSSTKTTNSFRDAVCMSCYEDGVFTLFEIKTRWDSAIDGKNTTYAGDYVALNALFSVGANVYMVVLARDTGIVRMGKVTFAFMKANEKFLYSVQERLGWGTPNTTVKCGMGINPLREKTKPLVDILSKDILERIANEALEIVCKDQ